MNHTTIPWVKNPNGTQGYTTNPITGCRNHDDGLCRGGGFPCYAHKLANGRVKNLYLEGGPCEYMSTNAEYNPFYPRLWPNRLHIPRSKTPRGIFPCDMSDLFGIGIPEEWTRAVLDECQRHPDDRFYLLTKQPQNLPKFSPFPDNCWPGVTATNEHMSAAGLGWLRDIEAKVKFMSLEPLLSWCEYHHPPWALWFEEIHWLIIGACTGTKADMEALVARYPALTLMPFGKKWTAQPRIEWVQEIIAAADATGIPVFLKDNLKPLLKWPVEYKFAFAVDRGCYHIRQEMPK